MSNYVFKNKTSVKVHWQTLAMWARGEPLHGLLLPLRQPCGDEQKDEQDYSAPKPVGALFTSLNQLGSDDSPCNGDCYKNDEQPLCSANLFAIHGMLLLFYFRSKLSGFWLLGDEDCSSPNYINYSILKPCCQ